MSARRRGPLAGHIDRLVEAKRAAGFDASALERRLRSLDAWCADGGVPADGLTGDVCRAWLEPRDGEGAGGVSVRAGALRQLARWLGSEGVAAWSPPEGYAGCARPRFDPYIYTDDEISAFFQAADRLPPCDRSPLRRLVAPTIFRVAYCCGLRPQELTGLTRGDLDAKAATLAVVDSKRRRDRVVPMSDDVAALVVAYDRAAEGVAPGRAYLFESGARPGARLGADWVQRLFRACWRISGVEFGERRPRVYDWRHNHATRVVARWMDEGRDVWAMLPRLSAYLGHSSVESTARYVHLVPCHRGLRDRSSWACPGSPGGGRATLGGAR